MLLPSFEALTYPSADFCFATGRCLPSTFSFVQVADHRAACMEPTSQLSGYRNGCYVATKDNASYFYFDLLSKGRHTVETTYYIDRAGSYRTGLCTAQCAYSPEFAGRDKSWEVKSE